jgi:hypothetical protein
MNAAHYVAWFFGGAFRMNAIQHVVAGSLGRAFQSPFATPPGQGLSSSAVNVLWGFFNLVVAWVLLVRAGSFDLHAWDQAATAGLGALLIALHLALHFGRFHGGNPPPQAPATPE